MSMFWKPIALLLGWRIAEDLDGPEPVEVVFHEGHGVHFEHEHRWRSAVFYSFGDRSEFAWDREGR
jgi:hypothetical protein